MMINLSGASLVVLAITPSMHRGHLIALLNNYVHTEFNDVSDPYIHELNNRLMLEAENSFGPFDTFSYGPLRGTIINQQPCRIQALNLAPRLVIADEQSQELLEHSQHPFIDRIYTAFILNVETRNEIIDAVDISQGNHMTAQTFTDLYYGMPVVALME